MAPVPRHGKGTRPLIGKWDFSDYLKQVTVSASMEPAEVTTFQDNDKNFIPGLKDGTFAFDGFFTASTSTGGEFNNWLDDALGSTSKHLVTVALSDSTGGRALMMRADQTSYDISSPLDDVVSVSVDTQGSSGYYGGVMLRPLSAATATGSNTGVATPGTTSAGGTTSGGFAHFHLTAQSTLTSYVGKVQHSTSGSTWADLITFTAATHETFQRSTVAGTVKERTRFTISTLTGGAGKTVTSACAFSRRKRT